MPKNRKRPGRSGPVHPAGSKLVRRFIRDAKGEAIAYRKTYMAMTGREYA